MSHLPPVVWLVIGIVVLVMVGLCVATAYAILRARAKIARCPASRLIVLGVAAIVPWLVVWLVPIAISVNIHGAIQATSWLILILLVFALLVLLPVAVVTSGVVWWKESRRPITDSRGPT